MRAQPVHVIELGEEAPFPTRQAHGPGSADRRRTPARTKAANPRLDFYERARPAIGAADRHGGSGADQVGIDIRREGIGQTAAPDGATVKRLRRRQVPLRFRLSLGFVIGDVRPCSAKCSALLAIGAGWRYDLDFGEFGGPARFRKCLRLMVAVACSSSIEPVRGPHRSAPAERLGCAV